MVRMSSAAPPSLSGKIALVTGASRGIGRGIALQLGEAGATVYITGRDEELRNYCNTVLSVSYDFGT